jgi:hypothetical protein
MENKKPTLEWKEPPNPVRYKKDNTKWHDIADMLRGRPNEWALVAEDVNPSVVTHIRRGRLKAFEPEGMFDASGQGRNERGYTKELYVRFIGKTVAVSKKASATNSKEYRVESIATPETASASTPAFIAPDPSEFFGDPEL